jgi:hypothetical protein
MTEEKRLELVRRLNRINMDTETVTCDGCASLIGFLDDLLEAMRSDGRQMTFCCSCNAPEVMGRIYHTRDCVVSRTIMAERKEG